MTGTSLMGSFSWNRNTGLVSSNVAVARPHTAPATRRPSRNAATIATPPSSGTTKNGPSRPNRTSRPAITIGRPGGYVGTIVPRWTPGRYPSGENVHSASGQGTRRESGSCWTRLPAAHRCAWLTYPYASAPNASNADTRNAIATVSAPRTIATAVEWCSIRDQILASFCWRNSDRYSRNALAAPAMSAGRHSVCDESRIP